MSELPPGWASTTVRELANPQARSLTDGPFGSNLKTEHYVAEFGPRVIRLQNIGEGFFRDEDQAFISKEHFELLRRHDARPGDVLIAALGDVLPRACLVPEGIGAAIVKADCFRFRPAHGVNARLVQHLLNSPQVRGATAHLISGVGRPRLNLGKVGDIRIPLAPVPEQERIVAAIEEQFSRIDVGDAALRNIRQSLRQMKAVVLENAIAGTGSRPFDRIQFGDLLREPLRNGHSAKADPAGSVRIWSLTAVTDGNFSLQNTKVTSADLKRVRDLWVQPGDLLIERSNTPELVGTARLYDGPPNMAVFPDLMIRARVSDHVLPRFAELVLQAPSSRRYFQRRAQGISGSMPKIDQATIEGLGLYLPPVETQIDLLQSTERQLSAIDLLEGVLKKASIRSARLRSSILAAAFSGKLVHQDHTDEPASALLERIAAERATSNGRKPARSRTPRSKVTA